MAISLRHDDARGGASGTVLGYRSHGRSRRAVETFLACSPRTRSTARSAGSRRSASPTSPRDGDMFDRKGSAPDAFRRP